MIPRIQLDAFLANCQVADGLHWWGASWLSHQIEMQTGGGPSHFAMVRRIEARTPTGIILVESTAVSEPKRFIGVVERSFNEEFMEYRSGGGQGVWTPLASLYRMPSYDWLGDWGPFMDHHVGDVYAYGQMVLEAYNQLVISHHIPLLDTLATDFARANWHQEYCSMLGCIGYQHMQVLSSWRIPGLTAPTNMWQAKMWGDAGQFLGVPLALPNDLGYNTVAA